MSSYEDIQAMASSVFEAFKTHILRQNAHECSSELFQSIRLQLLQSTQSTQSTQAIQSIVNNQSIVQQQHQPYQRLGQFLLQFSEYLPKSIQDHLTVDYGQRYHSAVSPTLAAPTNLRPFVQSLKSMITFDRTVDPLMRNARLLQILSFVAFIVAVPFLSTIFVGLMARLGHIIHWVLTTKQGHNNSNGHRHGRRQLSQQSQLSWNGLIASPLMVLLVMVTVFGNVPLTSWFTDAVITNQSESTQWHWGPATPVMQGPYTGVFAQILHFAAFYEVFEAIICLLAQFIQLARRHYRHYKATRTPIGSQSQSPTKTKTTSSTGSQAETDTETDGADSSLTLSQPPEVDSESEPEPETESKSKSDSESKHKSKSKDEEMSAPPSFISFSLSWLRRLFTLYLRIWITRISTYSPYYATYSDSDLNLNGNGTEYAGYTDRVEYAIEPIRSANVSWVWRNRVLRTDVVFQNRWEFNQDARYLAAWFIVTFVASCVVFQFFASRLSWYMSNAIEQAPEAEEVVSEPVLAKVDVGISTEPWIVTGNPTTGSSVQTQAVSEEWIDETIVKTQKVLDADLETLIHRGEGRSKKTDKKIGKMKGELNHWYKTKAHMEETLDEHIQTLAKYRFELPEMIARHGADNLKMGEMSKQIAEALQRLERDHEKEVRENEEKRYRFEMHWEAKVRTAIHQVIEIQKERAAISGDTSAVEELEKALALNAESLGPRETDTNAVSANTLETTQESQAFASTSDPFNTSVTTSSTFKNPNSTFRGIRAVDPPTVSVNGRLSDGFGPRPGHAKAGSNGSNGSGSNGLDGLILQRISPTREKISDSEMEFASYSYSSEDEFEEIGKDIWSRVKKFEFRTNEHYLFPTSSKPNSTVTQPVNHFTVKEAQDLKKMTEELIAATSDEAVRNRAQALLEAAFQQENFVEFGQGQNFLDVFLDIAEMRKNIREPRKSTFRMTDSERRQERERREKALTRNYTHIGPAALCVASGINPQQIGVKVFSTPTWGRFLDSGRDRFLPRKSEDPQVVEANIDIYFAILKRYFGERDTLLDSSINDDTKSRGVWVWDTNLIARRLLENLGIIQFRNATTDGTIPKPPPPPVPKATVEITPTMTETAQPSTATSASASASSSVSSSASASSSASSAAPVSAFSFTFTPPAYASASASTTAPVPAPTSATEVSSSESSSEHTPKPRTTIERGSELGLEPVSETEPIIVAIPEQEAAAPAEHVQPVVEHVEAQEAASVAPVEVPEANDSVEVVEVVAEQTSVPEPEHPSQLQLQTQPLLDVKIEPELLPASVTLPLSPVSPISPKLSESPQCENESPSEEAEQFEYPESHQSDACVEQEQEEPPIVDSAISFSTPSAPSALPLSPIQTARSTTPAASTPVKRVQVDWRQEALAEEAALAAQHKQHSPSPQKQRGLGGNNNNNHNNHNNHTSAAVKGYHRRRSQGYKGNKNKGASA